MRKWLKAGSGRVLGKGSLPECGGHGPKLLELTEHLDNALKCMI